MGGNWIRLNWGAEDIHLGTNQICEKKNQLLIKLNLR